MVLSDQPRMTVSALSMRWQERHYKLHVYRPSYNTLGNLCAINVESCDRKGRVMGYLIVLHNHCVQGSLILV
jgi:hypothetical protein